MILNTQMLREAAQEARNQSHDTIITESLQHFDTSITFDLFISHSFKDKDYVVGLDYLFTAAGYTVYIDWIEDSQLDRDNVTPKTAAWIKARIAQSKGAAYVATANSSQSRWCPWELGVSDGMNGRACILPVMSNSFDGQEYLGLYPYLEYKKAQGENRYDFWVIDQENSDKYISLKSWLSGKDPRIH